MTEVFAARGENKTKHALLRSFEFHTPRMFRMAGAILLCVLMPLAAPASGAVERKAEPLLRWGADREGGGPYVYPDPADPARVKGVEVELAKALGKLISRRPELVQCAWDQMLLNLERGDVDIALNGYEFTPQRAHRYSASIPYYVYELGLCVRDNDSATKSWSDLDQTGPRGHRKRIGVLRGSAADRYVSEKFGKSCEVLQYYGATETFLLVDSGQLDATVQDLPALVFYLNQLKRYPRLKIVDRPEQPGYYVLYARRDDEDLVRQLNSAIRQLYDDGSLRRLYEEYGMWNASQEKLPEIWSRWTLPDSSGDGDALTQILAQIPLFFRAAGVTVLLAVLSMPLAIIIGLTVALIRAWPTSVLGGQGTQSSLLGRLVRSFTAMYVEIVRGTPLVFQLFVVYFVLPNVGVTIDPFGAGVLALAVNYSAYEAEIFRLGIQSIPLGQMEAALSLGMSRRLAIRRIILPQAIRVVIPATANDFIALYKDTAVCSVIAVVELSNQYSIAAKSTGLYLQMALLASLLYLAMSFPLSLLASWLERRLNPGRS